MANEIQAKFDSEQSFTITLNSLANGSGRSSASVSNTNDRPGGIITVRLRGGTTPSADYVAEVYLLRDTGTAATDEWPGTNAAFTVNNAYCLGSIKFTASAGAYFTKEFDTSGAGPLGPTFGIAIVNNSGAALNATGNTAYYRLYCPEVQ
jgi:hypothetical protein